MIAPVIAPDIATAPEVLALLSRHLDLMRASSPACSVHALDAQALTGPDVAFFTLRDGGVVLGTGALKRITADHAEIKSMHIASEARGRGFARLLLDRLLSEAQALGYTRPSLETGSQDVFAPARMLYAKAGFADCGPFEGYTEDPNSIFMTKRL